MFLGRFQERCKKSGSAWWTAQSHSDHARVPNRCELDGFALILGAGDRADQDSYQLRLRWPPSPCQEPTSSEPGNVQAEFGIAHRAFCRSARAVPRTPRLGTSPCRRSASSWLRSAST